MSHFHFICACFDRDKSSHYFHFSALNLLFTKPNKALNSTKHYIETCNQLVRVLDLLGTYYVFPN